MLLIKRLFHVATLYLSFALLASVSAHAQDAMQRMLEQRTIKIGWIAAPPTAYQDPKSGKVTGSYVELVNFIMEQAKVKPEFIETSWSTFAAGLQAKQFDLVVGGTFATISRATAVGFTVPINYMGYTASARKGDTRFKTLADIDQPGVKVAVTLGGGGQEFVRRNFKKAEILSLNTSDLTADLAAVDAKRADVAIEDVWATTRYINEHPSMVNLFPDHPFDMQAIAWTVRRNDLEFLNFLNTSIEWMRINGVTDTVASRFPSKGHFVVEQVYRPLGN